MRAKGGTFCVLGLTWALLAGCEGGGDGGGPVSYCIRFSPEPSQTEAGHVLGPLSVMAVDSRGGTLSHTYGTVTLSLGTNPSGAGLEGSTAAAMSAGVAVLDDLSIRTVGSGYTLVASMQGFTDAESVAFSVVTGAANRLAFIGVPMGGHRNCAVVKLFVEGESGERIGPDIFAQRARMCGDPDSAFEDISER